MDEELARILGRLETKVEDINTNIKKQNGRLDRHSAAISEGNVRLAQLTERIKRLPCGPRLDACDKRFGLLTKMITQQRIDWQWTRRTKIAVVSAVATILVAIATAFLKAYGIF